MMKPSARSTLYDILELSADASTGEIKSAFRRLSLRHHPDTNHNSPESTARFKTIHNAYCVLANPETRREYDIALQTRSVSSSSNRARDAAQGPSAGLLSPDRTDAVSLVLDHLSFILWDIEELIHEPEGGGLSAHGRSREECLLMMLTFIDTWVLDTAGYPDYFFEARRIAKPAKIGGSPHLPYYGSSAGHRPYGNIEDYFYDIRRRMDRFLTRAGLTDLLRPVSGMPVRLIDCIFEAHNYCVHHLWWAKRAQWGECESIPPFRHSNALFEAPPQTDGR